MIQNRLNDKEKDVRGLKKQTSSLLNCAWEKGYVAGFDDGYKSGRQAEERPKGKWIRTGSLGNGNAHYECSNCHYCDEHAESQEVPYCWYCGARMESEL